MQSLQKIESILSKNKEHLFIKYGLKLMAIFGSYARNQQQENSDIDIMVEFDKPVGIEFIDLALELENLLKHKVDLVSRNAIKNKYFQSIYPDLKYV